jgi:hypothetical protein
VLLAYTPAGENYLIARPESVRVRAFDYASEVDTRYEWKVLDDQAMPGSCDREAVFVVHIGIAHTNENFALREVIVRNLLNRCFDLPVGTAQNQSLEMISRHNFSLVVDARNSSNPA